MTVECLYLFNVCLFISFIIEFRFCSSQVIAIERENVELLFSYNSTNDVNFQLQYENNPAFYRSKYLNCSNLKPDQQSRFKVKEKIVNKNWSNLYLTILDVSRYDAGIYRCLVSDANSPLYTILNEVDLIVDYPPGKAHCDLLPSNETFHSAVIECNAEAGNVRAYIICIQNGELALPKTGLFSNLTILYQQMFVVENEPLHCCTSTEIDLNDISKCNDFTLYLQSTTPVFITTTPVNTYDANYDMGHTVALTFLIFGCFASVMLISCLMCKYNICKCLEKYVRYPRGWNLIEEDTQTSLPMDELSPSPSQENNNPNAC